MKKKLSWTLTAICSWGVMLLVCGIVMTTMTACGDDDEETAGNGIDDLAFLQRRIANDGTLVYGIQLGTDTKGVMSRPVATIDEAESEFYKLLPGGANHEGLSVDDGGKITCRLTAAGGKSQGTITYTPSQDETVYYCAEVSFSAEVISATGISCLRYILFDRWPEEGNGFLKDILDAFKR